MAVFSKLYSKLFLVRGSIFTLLLSLLGSFALAASRPTVDVFFSGRRYSSLEPCGCHSRQQGGVQYEATLYEQVSDRPSIRLDCGFWSSSAAEHSPSVSLRTRYLLRALDELDYEAINLGSHDIALGAHFYENFTQEYPRIGEKLLSTNTFLKDQPEQRPFAPYRIVTRALTPRLKLRLGVIGVLETGREGAGRTSGHRIVGQDSPPESDPVEIGEYLVKPASSVLPSVIHELRGRVDILVLLYAGEFAAAERLALGFSQIDYILTSGRSPRRERNAHKIGRVEMLSVHQSAGKEVGRFGIAVAGRGHWLTWGRPSWHGVTMDVQPDPELNQLIEQFKHATRRLEVIPDDASLENVYAGVGACRSCHAPQTVQWQQTAHAHALQTLVDKGQQFNPECLPCHTLGFQHENGFWSVNHPPSQHKQDVQCENCHGPARDHVRDQLKLQQAGLEGDAQTNAEQLATLAARAAASRPDPNVPPSTCLRCHTPENDDRFVYAEKVLKVDHHVDPPRRSGP